MEKKYNSKLNERQLEAVNCTEGPLLILAGAGSGKTTVLINRIIHILEEGLARPWEILAITFTNKAAGELKNRLETALGSDSLDIWACTFHSACVRILRMDADKLGFDRYFNIYDTSDSLSLIKHILKDQNLDEKFFPPKVVLGEISRAKDAYLWPEDFRKMANLTGDLHKIRLADIYTEYMRKMADANSFDFDDLLLFTVRLFNEFPEIRKYWQRRFRYLLIDEYQDTNRLQYLFASLIVNEDANICVVGDDDQSIYKFRGATIENILSFESQFPGCRTIRLEQNYRSTTHILDAANSVIANNHERKGKMLWSENGTGELIQLYCADNQDDEAQYVSSTMLKGFSEGENWRDFAVLYRMNAQSNSLEYAFKRNGIPYRIVGGTRFFDRAEVKDVLAYLNVIASPNDSLRLERIINIPPRGIGTKSVEIAEALANTYQLSLYDVISHADEYSELSRPAFRMKEFASMMDELRAFSENNTPDLLLDELLEKSGYLRMYEEKNTIEDTARAENVREVRTSIITYMKDSGDNSLEGYLANVALYTDLDNYDTESDAVTLMTIHSSKGLEFPTVFIVGMEESIFPPSMSSYDESELEEERRLCYVAITRAMKNLHLVCARQRMLFGHTNANRASRFIDEIPEEHIRKNLPKGYGYHDTGYVERQYAPRKIVSAAAPISVGSVKKETTDLPDLSLGDNIVHTAFGEGVIIKMTPMGNDYLIEINFAKTGPKKLMLRAAARFIQKG